MSPPRLFSFGTDTQSFKVWLITNVQLAAALLRDRNGLILVGAAGLARIAPNDNHDVVKAVSILNCVLPSTPREVFNDGKVHRSGVVMLASSDEEEIQPIGGMERIGPDGTRSRLAGKFVIGNGPAFSPDGRIMYASDTVGRRIMVTSLDEGAAPDGPTRVFASMAESDGSPDGMTVDAAGALWVACWAGGQVMCYHPDGRVLRRIAMPVRNVTSCAFGGPDLRTLYITTANPGPSDPDSLVQSAAGGLFAVETDVAGLVEPELTASFAASATSI
jgi:D-xylonolactonase